MTSSVTFPSSNHLLKLRGRDARDFLHRLTTVNIRNMEPGDFKPGFLLSAQGKIRAAFRIGCIEENEFLIEIEDGNEGRWKDALLKALDEMTFAEKYELTEITGMKNAWLFGSAGTKENQLSREGEFFLLQGSAKTYGKSWLSVWGPSPAVDAFVASRNAIPLTSEGFDRLRILALAPRIDTELLLDSNPLEIGLREGIADQKGCYPGQEVIEKIISLGSPAKRLALVSGRSSFAPKAGDKLFTPEGLEVGTLSSVTAESGSFSGLTLLRKNMLELGKKLKAGPTADGASEAAIERIADYE